MTHKERKKLRLVWLKELKANSPCVVCGESDPACIEFHHLDSDEKDGTISGLIRSTHDMSKIQEEVDKCVPLCANCHRKVHADSIRQVPAGEWRRYKVFQWEVEDGLMVCRLDRHPEGAYIKVGSRYVLKSDEIEAFEHSR